MESLRIDFLRQTEGLRAELVKVMIERDALLATGKRDEEKSDRALTQVELGKRLGFKNGAPVNKATKRCSSEEFANWSKERDPEQKSWRYDGELKHYFSIS